MSDLSDSEAEELRVAAALSEPFAADEVKFKPAVVSGNRALALCYIDARAVMDRLDEVLGVTGWQDEYTFLPDGSVLCKLRIRVNGEWITKSDVGGESEQPDEGDRHKAAVSDALKRVAVKFGVGRYLYRLPQLWADYDPQKRQFKQRPTLPPEALPRKPAPQQAARQPAQQPAAAPPAPQPAAPPETALDKIKAKIAQSGEAAVRKAALDKAAQFGVPAQVALAQVDALAEEDLTPERLVVLAGLLSAVEKGTKKREEAFPGVVARAGKPKSRLPDKATQEQQAEMQRAARKLGWDDNDVREALGKYKARFWAELEREQAEEILLGLREALAKETAGI